VINQDNSELVKTTLERLGRRVRDARRSNGWTQEIFAEKANINDKEVSHIELGNRNITIETLIKIAVALKITPVDLIAD